MTLAVPVPTLAPAVTPLPPVFRARVRDHLRARAEAASRLPSAHPIDARVFSV